MVDICPPYGVHNYPLFLVCLAYRLKEVTVNLKPPWEPAHPPDEVVRESLEPSLHLLSHCLLRRIKGRPFTT